MQDDKIQKKNQDGNIQKNARWQNPKTKCKMAKRSQNPKIRNLKPGTENRKQKTETKKRQTQNRKPQPKKKRQTRLGLFFFLFVSAVLSTTEK
jgi:hypothetical protein